MLFLHGRGGSTASFRYASYSDAADAAGFVLIYWQGRTDPNGLFSSYYIDAANGIPDETDVLACLDDALAHFAIDTRRVHLVGFSHGGKGALLVGLKNPDRFASVTDGAGPTDAFQGQLWSPTFRDYRDAAGGDAGSAAGPVLARWFAQSPRFFLPNARNLPLALYHGGLDDVVPDSPFLFPYRNTHHVADTPGFTDARGATPTLAELHAADPAGYPFETHYPAGVGHDEEGLLDASSLFGFFAGKATPERPERIVATVYETGERSYYWARLARTAPPDGAPDTLAATADGASNRVTLRVAGAPAVTLLPARAGLDAARRLEIRAERGGRLALRIEGGFPSPPIVTRDGARMEAGVGYRVEGGALVFPPLALVDETLIAVEPAPAAPLTESDLLVPALVHADGLNGARFRSELALANLSASEAVLSALFLDGSGRETALRIPPRSALALDSGTLFAGLGLPGGAAPLRLRVTAGDPAGVAASARVYNQRVDGGTYGLSFPVETAGASVLGAGEAALVFGGTRGSPERVNVSFFAPFEASSATVEVLDGAGNGMSSRRVTLGPLERLQLNDTLAGVAPPARLGVTVETGRIQAYATVISNSPTNDPYRSPALGPGRTASSWVVPAVASVLGRNGAVFSSDLSLAAASLPASVTLTYRPADGAPERTARLDLAPGATRAVTDVLGTLFPSSVPGYGSLELDATFPIEVLAVTRSDPPTGPSSQDVPGVPAGEEITAGSPAAFAGVAESALARTNVVLVNRGPATSVSLTLLAEDGPRGTLEIPLAEGEMRQLNSVAALFSPQPTEAAVLLVAPGAGGAVVASATRIDNATNDPAGIAPVRTLVASFP